MANSIIKSISFTNEWKNPQGQIFYYHLIEFENGDKGQIGAKSKMPDKLQVGKSLDYEKATDEKGNVKIKAISLPPNVYKGGSGKQFDPEAESLKQRMIIAQSCLSSSAQFYQQKTGIDPIQVMSTAKEFYDWVLETSK